MLTKKTILLSGLLLLSPVIHAKVIELDNINPNHCRQQLVTGYDPAPIVMIYMEGCPWADKVRPIYEKVADLYPDKTFFAFNFMNLHTNKGEGRMMRTAIECLGITPFQSPIFARYKAMVTPYPDKYYGYINGITEMGLDGTATQDDLIRFVDKSVEKAHVTVKQ